MNAESNSLIPNPESTSALRKEELRSFQRFCKRHALSPDDYIAESLAYFRRQRELAMDAARKHPVIGHPSMAKYLEAATAATLPKIDNYWEFIRDTNESHRLQDLNAISALRSIAAVDESYVNYLLSEIGLPSVGLSKMEAIKLLISKVPYLNFFDLEFTGTVGRSKDLGICLVVYPHLYEVTNIATSVLLNLAFRSEASGLYLRDSQEISMIAREPRFVAAFSALFLWAQGMTYRIPFPEEFAAVRHPHGPLNIEFAAQGGKQFVRLHEIFHLLLGHLEESRRAAKELEHAADAYAAATLVLGARGNDTMSILNAAGIASVFGVFQMLEGPAASQSDTHPTPRERVHHIEKQIEYDRVAILFSIFEKGWMTSLEVVTRFAQEQER